MMGPRPEPTDLPKDQEAGNPDSGSESDPDGWHIGYAVEMNGVYRQNSSSADSSSDEEIAGNEEDHSERAYMGYEAITSEPVEDGQSARSSEGNAHESSLSAVTSPQQSDFQRALDSSADVHLRDSDFPIPHCPQPIELDKGKIEEIKKAMSSFSLPPPSWAESIKNDDEFKKAYEAVMTKRSL